MTNISLNGKWSAAGVPLGTGERHGWADLSSDSCAPEVLKAYASEAIEAAVPGQIHLDLLRVGKIEEPLYGENARDCAWLENYEWWYRTTFQISEQLGKRSELTFEGLDTLAHVWLNGNYLGRHNNAFIAKTFDITEQIRVGENTLLVRVDPGISGYHAEDFERYQRVKRSDATVRVLVRKPQFSFGWDWGPRLITCGIWRGVSIKTYQGAALRAVHLTDEIEGIRAVLRAEVEMESFAEEGQDVILKLVCEKDGDVLSAVASFTLESGRSRHGLSLEVADVDLWWPATHGTPHLYNVHVTLVGQKELDSYNGRYGFRTLKVVEEPRADGKGDTFYFELNGLPIFCKGANWIPADSIPARVGEDKLKTLLLNAQDANFNMLRVWGGGYYESDLFYQLCDELGIMVWQDFMFACGFYPDDNPKFLEEVKTEAEAVVKRLRNHPSLVIWCGNNENDWIYIRELKQDPSMVFYGKKINHQVLPEIVARHDPTRTYRKSSPYGSDSDLDPNTPYAGNQHNWEVTLLGNDEREKANFYNYAREEGSFLGEFGLICPPNPKTIRQMLGPKDSFVNSDGWKYHNNTLENGVQAAALELFWGTSSERVSLEDYVFMLQIYQAEGLKFALEHFRRRMFDCGGSLFWMYNDSWGAIGWSMIDYYLRKKPANYVIKKAYAPTILTFRETEKALEIWLVHDTPISVTAEVIVEWSDYSGERHFLAAQPVSVLGPCSQLVAKVRTVADHRGERGFYLARLEQNGSCLTWNRHFLCFPGTVQLPRAALTLSGERTGQGWKLCVKSDVYAWGVWFDLADDEWISDNAFDLLPGMKKELVYRGGQGDFQKLKVTCANDLTGKGIGERGGDAGSKADVARI